MKFSAMKRSPIEGLTVFVFLGMFSLPARAELSLTLGSVDASILGDTKASDYRSGFQEKTIHGHSFGVEALTRPFPLKMFGFGLRYQNMDFNSFEVRQGIDSSSAVDSINLWYVSPVVNLKFQALFGVGSYLCLSHARLGKMVQLEAGSASAYKLAEGYRASAGLNYEIAPSQMILLEYATENITLTRSGTAAAIKVNQIIPWHISIGLQFNP